MEGLINTNGNQPSPSRSPKRPLRPALLLALGLALGLWGGAGFDRLASTGCSSSKGTPDFGLMREAWNEIEEHYVQRSAVKPTTLTYGAISGMVDALGDTGHSTFLSPAMVKELKETQQGHLEGIGAEIKMKDGRVVVVAPLDGSPAQRAGLRPGDVILKVNGLDIAGLPVTQVVSRITGKPGTMVRLTLLDPRSGQTREVAIERASIKLESVTWHKLPGTTVTHLRIASFDNGTTRELRKALTQIVQDSTNAIILDLRSNPGGLLEEAVDSASQFLSHGNVLLVKNAKGHVTPVPVETGGLATNVPMAVLINVGSASGAEIVAGALRDAHRGPLVGETTFGTGTVLEEFPLRGGSALLLAIEEWLTPNGHSFWHKGIAPNVVVALPPKADMLLPEAEQGMTAAQLQACGDTQLLRALSLLKGH
jgi:carboxyl-terminal processing protease